MTNEILTKSAAELSELLKNKELSSVEITKAYLDNIEKNDKEIGAFLQVTSDLALETAKNADAKLADSSAQENLTGVPIAIKDVIVTKGIPTTAASKILEGWIPPYDATIMEKINAAALPVLGKTNMDEFAMGSSTEHSAYQITKNPLDHERIPGGSGGGSAAAVAANFAPIAIGTDTGGSIRQPASVTGTVGAKPTYGAVSRYGLIAMSSSLDQAGPCSTDVLSSAMLQELISGYDPKDSTSSKKPALSSYDSLVDAVAKAKSDLESGDLKSKKLRVGIISELNGGEGFEPEVAANFKKTCDDLKAAGIELELVDCPSFKYALAAYYIIMPSEVSSNLAKFDGMRFGVRVDADHVTDMMKATREYGFGDEVKRRIILGTYALSAGYYDAYYGTAQKVRTMIQRDLNDAFSKFDVLLSPTSPNVAFKFGSKTEDPLAMYMNDIATIPVNLAGIPAMSVPNGTGEAGLPTGVQVWANQFEDDKMYYFAELLELLNSSAN